MSSSSVVVVVSLYILCVFVALLRADYEVILNHKDVADGYFSPDLPSTGLENADNPGANTYSIIGNFDAAKRAEYLNDGAYQLKLQFRHGDGTTELLEWTQTSWITEPTITGFRLIQAIAIDGSDYALSQDQDAYRFLGLGLNVGSYSANSYLDGNGAYSSEYFQAVGAMRVWGAGFPSMLSSWNNGNGAAHGETLWISAPGGAVSPTPTTVPTTAARTTGAPTSAPTRNPGHIYEVILDHKDVADGYFSPDLPSTGLENADNPGANTYSIIGNFDAVKRAEYQIDDGAYRLKLLFTYADKTTDLLEWTQTSWITEPTITGFSLIQAIGTDGSDYDLSQDADQNQFRGLGLNVGDANGDYSVYSYLDGNGDSYSQAAQAVGSMISEDGGIPGMYTSWYDGHGAAHSQTLWISAPGGVSPTPTPTRNPDHICHSAADFVDNGKVGAYYSFTGRSCYCSGDPHCTPTFHGANHNFQGRDARAYVYMTACADSSVEAMPFQVLAKHYEYVTDGVQTIDYVTLKLFDGDNYDTPFLVQIHSSEFFCSYPASDSDSSDLLTRQSYDDNTGICVAITAGTTAIGDSGRFSITYTQTSANRVDVTLTVWGECELTFYLKKDGSGMRGGRNRVHTLNIYPPECFRCHTCGWCGVFKQFPNGEMPTCDGGRVRLDDNYGAFAYDKYGNTYDAEQCCGADHDPACLTRRRLVGAGELYTPDLGDFEPVEACNQDVESAVIAALTTERAAVDDCCVSLGDEGATCDKLQEGANVDGCVMASVATESDAPDVDSLVQELFTNKVNDLCAENDALIAAQIANGEDQVPLFDPVALLVDEDAEVAIKATRPPTSQPTETQATAGTGDDVGGSTFGICIANSVIASALTFIFM